MASQSKRNSAAGPIAVRSMVELFVLHDKDFVRASYQLIFGRDADPSGLSHFTERLREGATKIDVLAGLRQSDEGQRVAFDLPWLDRAIARRRRQKNRWVGFFFRLLGNAERDDPSSVRLRGIENNLRRLCNENEARLDKIDSAIDRLQFTTSRQSDALAEFLMRSSGKRTTVESKHSTYVPPIPRAPTPKDQRGLSSRASKFMRMLRAAQDAATAGQEG